MDKPKKPARQDWHKEDIKAALRKAGTNLTKLGQAHGLGHDSLRQVLKVPIPKWERIVAEFLCVPPQTIWPSRYRPDGSPKSRPGERGLGRYKRKSTPAAGGCNVNVEQGDSHGRA